MSSLASLSSAHSSSLHTSSTLSSHASHNVSRGVAKLAVDVGAWYGNEIATLKTEAGKKYVTLGAELGEEEYNQLCTTAGLTLLTINYCQRGLQELGNLSSAGDVVGKLSTNDSAVPARLLHAPGVENIKSLKGLINHDYLVLEIQPGDSKQPIFYVVAQKLSGEKPGIHISPVSLEKKEEVLHKGVLHYLIDCHTKIPLKSLLEILKEGSPHYSLRNANCWDYATATTKRLLQECAHMPGISTTEVTRLEKEYNDLEAHLTSRSIRSTFKFLLEKAPQFFKST